MGYETFILSYYSDIDSIYKKKTSECDPIRLWELLDHNDPLAQLAIHLFSFIPNSASCERIFSTMGNIKTKRRNRLTPQRTRDLALIKLDVRRQQAIEGTLRKRVKRAFGSFSDPSGSRVEDEEIAQIACAREEDNEDKEDLSTQISSMSDEANEADDGSPLTADVSFRAVAARLAADVAADEDAEDVGELENDESDNVSGRQV